MIEPISTYRYTLYLGLPSTHISKLDAVRKKAMSLIDNRSPPISDEIYKTYQRKASIEVFKCMNKLGPPAFDNLYFCNTNHNFNTRGNHSSLVLPNV